MTALVAFSSTGQTGRGSATVEISNLLSFRTDSNSAGSVTGLIFDPGLHSLLVYCNTCDLSEQWAADFIWLYSTCRKRDRSLNNFHSDFTAISTAQWLIFTRLWVMSVSIPFGFLNLVLLYICCSQQVICSRQKSWIFYPLLIFFDFNALNHKIIYKKTHQG